MSVIPPVDYEAPPANERWTDVGNAKRLINHHGDEFRYVGAWGKWLAWDGKRWADDTTGRIIEAAKQEAALLVEEALTYEGDQRKAAVKWAMQSEGAGRIRAMVELARSDARIVAQPEDFDTDPYLLNVNNGVIDLRTGNLKPHDAGLLVTKLAPADYEPDAACPTWGTFLEQILPDADVREFVARAIGYSLTGNVGEHKLFMPYGTGANGKSTLLEAVRHVLGDYADQAEPDLLLARRDAHPTGVAKLQGKRFVTASETNDQRRLDEANVKRLTGGDRQTARLMRQDFFEFDPTHKLWLTTNHRPQVRGTDNGIWRRIRVIPFTEKIPDEKQDHDLDAKLRSEAAGILTWAVAACLRWQHAGLTEPLGVTLATDAYRSDMDTLGEFIGDQCERDDADSVSASDLYDAYVKWCVANGEEATSQKTLGMRLTERGFDRVKQGAQRRWHWIGLRLVKQGVNP